MAKYGLQVLQTWFVKQHFEILVSYSDIAHVQYVYIGMQCMETIKSFKQTVSSFKPVFRLPFNLNVQSGFKAYCQHLILSNQSVAVSSFKVFKVALRVSMNWYLRLRGIDAQYLSSNQSIAVSSFKVFEVALRVSLIKRRRIHHTDSTKEGLTVSSFKTQFRVSYHHVKSHTGMHKIDSNDNFSLVFHHPLSPFAK